MRLPSSKKHFDAFNPPGFPSIRIENALAAERRQETLAYLCANSFRFGYLLTGFLAYVHWLVVQANRGAPPELGFEWFIGGLAVFVIATFAALLALILRFARVPR